MPEESSSAGSSVNAVRALRGKGAPGDELRALSVWFVINKLMDDLGAKDDSKVYNVEPRLREKGADTDCPRDGKKGAAYVDVAEDPYAGFATHMLSYTWGYYLKDIKDTLQRFCLDSSLDMKDVRVWMCFACVNQHRVKEAQAKGETVPFEAFKKIFGERVQKIGHILPMMSPWNAPFYITRVWCCFEIFTAINLGDDCKVTVLLPPGQSTEFSEAFDKGAEKMVFQALKTIDVETAQASMPEDKEQILKIIKEGPGYKKVNTEVVKHLREWFMTQACRNEVDRMCKLGRVYTTFGQYEAGIMMLQKSVEVLEKLGEKTSPLAVKVLTNITEAEFMHKFYDGDESAAGVALEAYMQAEEILKSTSSDMTFVAAELNTKICFVMREKLTRSGGDEDLKAEALKRAKQGRKLLEKLGQLKSCDGMWHLFNHALMLGDIAASERSDASFKDAVAVFEEAIAIGKELGLTGEEYYVKGIHGYGIFYQQLSRLDEAVDHFAEAKSGYEALGMTDTIFFLMCSFQTGYAYANAKKKQDGKFAKTLLKECINACEAVGNDQIMGFAKQILGLVEELVEEVAP